MNKVVFPGFNLNFEFSSIAIQFGSLHIYWYSICIVLGIIVSLILMYFTTKKHNIKYDELIEIMIFTLVFGIIGARLFYVLFNLEYYLKNINEIFNINGGGLAIFGGIMFGAATSYIICKHRKINFLDFCDYLVPYLALSQSIGRLGNFFNVEAYGIETKNVFRMGIETISGYKEVHPCFLYEMVGCLLIFIILKLLEKKQNYKGEILGYYLIMYGVIRFFIEALRADSLIAFNIKISQFISVIIVILGIVIHKKYKMSKNVD